MRYFGFLLIILWLTGCNLGTTSSIETTVPTVTVTSGERTLVAWVDAGNLVVWQTGDTLPRRIASGGVIEPYISPDGARIAFTRGPSGSRETLWLVNIAGTNERQLVGERPATYTPGENQIGDVVWADSETLFFNTLQQYEPFYAPLDDLYRVDVATQEIRQVAVASEGGRISISPDGAYLITVYAGTYRQADGQIRVFDLVNNTGAQDLLTFTGVSTASEVPFYPAIHWLPDNRTILTAIPDPDLIYEDAATEALSDTILWQIGISNPPELGIIGSVQASFFGLPSWSADGGALSYLQRLPNSNRFAVYLADGNGDNTELLTQTEIDAFDPPRWLPDGTQYIFGRSNEDGSNRYFLASRQSEQVILSNDNIFLVEFITDSQYIYVSQGDGRLELRLGTLSGTSQFIGSLNTLPIFDAVYITG